ncbi:hypothetical protein [Antiquaquibacter soli]|nr:hypothetical protein [Protaetiibacter sp. WY-16]
MLEGAPAPDVVATYLKKSYARVQEIFDFVVDSNEGPVVVFARTLSGDGSLQAALVSRGIPSTTSEGTTRGPFSAEAQVLREYSLYGYRSTISAGEEAIEVVGLLLGTASDVESNATAHLRGLARAVNGTPASVDIYTTGWSRPITIQVLFRSPLRKRAT